MASTARTTPTCIWPSRARSARATRCSPVSRSGPSAKRATRPLATFTSRSGPPRVGTTAATRSTPWPHCRPGTLSPSAGSAVELDPHEHRIPAERLRPRLAVGVEALDDRVVHRHDRCGSVVPATAQAEAHGRVRLDVLHEAGVAAVDGDDP